MCIYIFFPVLLFISRQCAGQEIVYENDMNFRIEPGATTCFFEKGEAGQTMEAKYQVIDGQHGDYDINFRVTDPSGLRIADDYKLPHNSIIKELTVTGDYLFCLDNTHSVMNSKMVFVYVVFEGQAKSSTDEAQVNVVEDGQEVEEVLEWQATDENGEPYYMEVTAITDTLTRTLKHVVKARHDLNMYSALKSRDSYLAFEDTFIVDMWSGFQISFMCLVGTLQVYMIKKLFNRPGRVAIGF